MSQKEEWNLTDIFAADEAYEKAKRELKGILEEIANLQGTLGKGADNLLKCYQAYEKALILYEKIYSYGMLQYHLDMANQEGIKIYKEVENIGTELSMAVSYIEPEILQIEKETLEAYSKDEKLKRYQRSLQRIIEEKEHTLSQTEEKLLAHFAEVFASAENTYDILTNAEMKYGPIQDEEGKEIELTDGNYSVFLRSKQETVRKQAFQRMYEVYAKKKNTITELYLTKVKQNTITANIRHYASSLEIAVKQDDSSLKVYETLVKTVNENLQANHAFMKLKKQLLQLPEMHLYDIYVNPFEEEKDQISYTEAKEEVIKALSILGEEYVTKLKEAFENRWIDVYEKENKRSGAYSMGVYGVHPYVLLNFVYSKRDVSTIAHELGHSMHSYYSNSNQPVMDANYTIMVAEVASTVNEILLAEYQIQKETNQKKKAILIYELLEMIRATFFRQTMFAEFEKTVHEKVEKGETLAAEDLNQIYEQLNQKYFGKEVIIDKEIQYEWERIPHFYTPFYVYKYATGISAAITIAMNLLKRKEGYQEKYIEMLKQGCSKKSIELLKMVDVDLETKAPYESVIQYYMEKMQQLCNI